MTHRGIPKILAEDDREILAEHLGCRPELLKHGQGHRRSTHARRPPPSDAYAAPQGYSVVLEADVRVEAGVEATGTATCVRRARGGCSPTRSSATGSRPIPAIFVIWDGIALVPKRIEHVPYSEPSRVILKSFNPEYGGHECAAEDVRIVGAGPNERDRRRQRALKTLLALRRGNAAATVVNSELPRDQPWLQLQRSAEEGSEMETREPSPESTMPVDDTLPEVLAGLIENVVPPSTPTTANPMQMALRQAVRAAQASEWDELLTCLGRAYDATETQGLRQEFRTTAKHHVRQFQKAAELGRFRAFIAQPTEERRLVNVATVSPPDCDACDVWPDDETNPDVLRFWASLPTWQHHAMLGWQYLCKRCLAGGWFNPEKRMWEMCDPKDSECIRELTS